MSDPVPLLALKTLGVSTITPIGSDGAGGAKILSAAEIRAAGEAYSSAQVDTLLTAKAPLASPTFIGTVSGITAAMVGAPSGSGTSSGTNTGDQDLSSYLTSSSAASTYLPLAGGTLTGPITGTSDIIEQRRGLNSQIFDLFETYTSGSDNGKLRLKATSAGHQIGSARSTSGSARALQLGHFAANGTFTSAISIDTAGAPTFVGGILLGSSTNQILLESGPTMFATSRTTAFISAGQKTASTKYIGWSVDADTRNAVDTAFSRNAAGVVEVNNGTAGTFRDFIVRNLRMSAPTLVPASAAATGSEGQIAWDSGFIYVCTAANTWKRVAIATW
jgi:hypothetical protein